MAPLAIGARVIERLLPWLTRVSAQSPAAWAKLTAALKTAGVATADKAADIVAYARQNPMNATLVFTTIASVGLSVADLFGSEDKADNAVRKTAMTLDSISLGIADQAGQIIGRVAADSEKISGELAAREVHMRLVQDICRWAKSHFGGVQQALEAHQKLQAFVELPYAEVEMGFRYLHMR